MWFCMVEERHGQMVLWGYLVYLGGFPCIGVRLKNQLMLIWNLGS